MSDAFFRASAGICLVDAQSRVLALRRRTVSGAAWQMAQGGIDARETPLEAALRELKEEAGVDQADVEVLAEHPEWLVYELPIEFRRPKVLRKTGWGQAQKWFLLRARPDIGVKPDGKEFDAFDWVTPRELMDRVVDFRRPVYARVFGEFFPHAGTLTAAE